MRLRYQYHGQRWKFTSFSIHKVARSSGTNLQLAAVHERPCGHYPYTISKLSAKYQFCAIHTADNTDGNVTGGGKNFTAGRKLPLHRYRICHSHPVSLSVSDSVTQSLGRSYRSDDDYRVLCGQMTHVTWYCGTGRRNKTIQLHKRNM